MKASLRLSSLAAILGGVLSLPVFASEGDVTLPFAFTHGAIVVTARINDQGPLKVLLDTGANPSVIDLQTARQIRLKLSGKGWQGDGSGTDVNLAYPTTLPKVELGGLTAENVEAAGLDLTALSKKMGEKIDGVLGYSLLKDRIVRFDYPKRQISFLKSAPPSKSHSAASAKSMVFPFRIEDDILFEGVTVNGRKILAMLDTGSNGTFQLMPAAVAANHLRIDGSKEQDSVGFNGAAKNSEGTVANVSVGAVSIDHPSVVVFGKGQGSEVTPWGIRVGNGFLKDTFSRSITKTR